MVENLKNATTLEGVKDISNAYASEDDINETRNKLREKAFCR